MAHLLEVENLKTYFNIDRGTVKAVDGVSFYIDKGEIMAVVGESGCGKSVTMLSTVQLIPIPPGKIEGGKVIFEGADLLMYESKSREMNSIRGAQISFVFQEPMTSLNPVLTINQQLTESMEKHLRMEHQAAREKAIELLKMVGITGAAGRIDDYPHQFSGGVRQRIMIAIALACNPKIIIADEPTTALDVTTQAQLLELMTEMVTKLDSALVIVTHNLGVVARYAQRIYVMYAGRVVESGTSEDIFGNPRHPYTIALLKSVPQLGETKHQKKLVPIDGLPPGLINMPGTCAFYDRCQRRVKQYLAEPWPALRGVGGIHFVSCLIDVQEK